MSLPRHDRLRLRHIRLLQLIEEDGSLRAVAERLNVSQPTVSAMLKDLEEAFGAQLVDRSVRGVTLNEMGRLALTRTRPCLSFIGQAAEEIETRDLPLLRVGCNPAVMLNPVPMALRRIRSGPVRNRFTFRTGLVNEMVEALITGQIDCYVGRVDWHRIAPSSADMLKCHPLGQSPLCIVGAVDHPLTRQGRIRPDDLLDYPWASASVASSNWQEVCNQFRQRGLKPPMPLVESGLFGLLSILAGTDCLSCVPGWVIRHRMSAGMLIELDVDGFDMSPAPYDFVSLVTPEEGTPMGDWFAALEAVVTPEGDGLGGRGV